MSEETLRREAFVDEPSLVGARWWQDSVVDPVGRRAVITGLLAAGGILGAGALIADVAGTRSARGGSLDLQRRYGWDFGASTTGLVFDGVTADSFDPVRLRALATELAPRVPSHVPFYVPTLFESLTALPKQVMGGGAPSTSLLYALRPIVTAEMKDSFDRGQASGASLLAINGVALVVDLPGPAAVAFAAGAASYFDPVFLFDNWPHPRGVVHSHRTLAAAAYYQPLFARARAGADAHGGAPPMFVLDRDRLAAYADDVLEFDNRWVARLPSPEALRSLGVGQIVYVGPGKPYAGARDGLELDDLNADFVAYNRADIRIGWLDASAIATTVEPAVLKVVPYVPRARTTPFSGATTGGGATTPQNFASVPLELSLLGGAVLAVRWKRDSWGWGRGGG